MEARAQAALLGGIAGAVVVALALLAGGLLRGGPGPAGPVGMQGPAGMQGIAGPEGGRGAAGPAGAQGPAGRAGATGPAGPQGVAGAGDPGPAEVLLVREPGACPGGWTAGGAVALNTSPDYALAPGQARSNPGITTSATMGFATVIFHLCTRAAAP